MAKSQSSKMEKINLDEIIGTNIRMERIEREFSRDELAEMLDLTTSHMGLIERGERGATAVTLSKLSRVLGIPIDSLFKPRNVAALNEDRDDAKSNLHKKISTLLVTLDEKELSFIAHVAQGLNKIAPLKDE